MSQSTSGPCLVCGEETTSRCGACRQARIDLFFCLREHQKLLWPVHKKVCGPGKANPFTWPGFSNSEASEIEQHLHDFVNGLRLGDPPFRDWGTDQHFLLHILYRHAAVFTIKYLEVNNLMPPATVPSWYTYSQHYLLAWTAISWRAETAPSSDERKELLRFVKIASSRLRRFIDTEVRRDKPAVAERVLPLLWRDEIPPAASTQ
ncbi:hypothetical protein JCM8097_002062 [Rhodosporidiobolus ruineniae]